MKRSDGSKSPKLKKGREVREWYLGGETLTMAVLPSSILGKKMEENEEGSMVVRLKDSEEFKEDS